MASLKEFNVVQEKLQRQRFELKYVVNESLAESVRDYVSSYLTLDEYGSQRPDLSYPVHSLYLDSPDLQLYHATNNGDKNRFKLRLRFYESRPDAPIGFEIKRRCNNVIIKRRARVKREFFETVYYNGAPCMSDLETESVQELRDLQEFVTLKRRLSAEPKAHVAYLREAWENPGDNSVRVTFDRQVRSEPEFSLDMSAKLKEPIFVFPDQVVLELKFTDRFPLWLEEMVQRFHLRTRSAAKYADGIELLNMQWMPQYRMAKAFV